jgi:signal peptidase I
MCSTKPRKPLVALLLSICPGLGQQYAGKLFRGIFAYIALIVISWLAAIAYMFEESRALSLVLLAVPFAGAALIAVDAVNCARRQPPDYRLKWFNRGWVYAGVFVGLLVTVNPLMDYLVGKRVVRAYLATTDSMYPAVYRYDLVMINKLLRPDRGDIVLIAFKERGRERASSVIRDQILRRVIARAGDTVEIRGRRVYLNGELLKEPYASYRETPTYNEYVSTGYRWGPREVPENAFFVLSDARQYGFDGRIFGFVDVSEISGVAKKVFWSWNFDKSQFQWARTALNL